MLEVRSKILSKGNIISGPRGRGLTSELWRRWKMLEVRSKILSKGNIISGPRGRGLTSEPRRAVENVGSKK